MTHVIREILYDARVAALLSACDLPTEDLPSNSQVTFFGVEAEQLRGAVALEGSGPSALVRSLAVTPASRGHGLGDALLRHVEVTAASRGVTELYLLTTTAEHYFIKRGYTSASRESAPAAIAATRQFAGLCPASSAFMVKRFVG